MARQRQRGCNQKAGRDVCEYAIVVLPPVEMKERDIQNVNRDNGEFCPIGKPMPEQIPSTPPLSEGHKEKSS